jgi:hypothetical protein
VDRGGGEEGDVHRAHQHAGHVCTLEGVESDEQRRQLSVLGSGVFHDRREGAGVSDAQGGQDVP